LKQEIGNPHDYDDRIDRTYKIIAKELSLENAELIKKYDRSMMTESLAKATRHKHLQVILNLTRFLGKDWKEAKRDDIDNVTVRVVQEYCNDSGQETNTSYDHKKILPRRIESIDPQMSESIPISMNYFKDN